MPASYAHYRFGKHLLPDLPADVRQCIQHFRRMFDAGLQGPDFFFYYNPFFTTATGKLGQTYHRQSGREFFTAACGAARSEAGRAYLYGLLAHYCLDSACHPFINRLQEIGEAGHVPLESEFERILMLKDGIAAPHTHHIGKQLKLTRGECMTVAEFYPGVTGGQISQSFRFMALFLKLLAHSNRKLQERVLGPTYPKLLEHRVPTQTDDNLVPYLSELSDLYRQAMAVFPGMLEELNTYLKTGRELGEAFASDFG